MPAALTKEPPDRGVGGQCADEGARLFGEGKALLLRGHSKPGQ